MDSVPLCFLFGGFSSDFIHQGILVCGKILAYRSGFPRSSAELSLTPESCLGTNRNQGSSTASRLPMTDSLVFVILMSLDAQFWDHVMLLAACTLGYFGFLRSAEFTVPNLGSSSLAFHFNCQGQRSGLFF